MSDMGMGLAAQVFAQVLDPVRAVSLFAVYLCFRDERGVWLGIVVSALIAEITLWTIQVDRSFGQGAPTGLVASGLQAFFGWCAFALYRRVRPQP